VIENLVKLKVESLRVAKERFARGLLASQEVDKVSIELENARARLIDAETSETEARAKLKALLGDDHIAISWPWKETLTSGPHLDEQEFSLEKRPDWRAEQASVDAERFRKRQALTRFLPSLNLGLSYGNSDLSQPDRRDWAAVMTLTLPLFDRLDGITGFRIQSLTYEQAELKAETIKRQAPAEIVALRQSLKAARESAIVREKTAKLSEKLFDENFQRFSLGRTSVNELAIDQSRLYESELLAVEGWASAHISQVRLCHAFGGLISSQGLCQL
jgi:outer membrane protein TolC